MLGTSPVSPEVKHEADDRDAEAGQEGPSTRPQVQPDIVGTPHDKRDNRDKPRANRRMHGRRDTQEEEPRTRAACANQAGDENGGQPSHGPIRVRRAHQENRIHHSVLGGAREDDRAARIQWPARRRG